MRIVDAESKDVYECTLYTDSLRQNSATCFLAARSV